MRKGLTVLLFVSVGILLIFGLWFVKLFWFRPLDIDHFFERVYIEFLLEDPEALSHTGILSSFEFLGYPKQLTDVSPDATRRLAEVGRNNLKILEEYDKDKLGSEQQVSYDVLHWFLKTGVRSEPFLFHDYPITHISGAHVEIPQLLNGLPIKSKNDIENYLSRLHQVDDKFGTVIDALDERKKIGIVPPTHIIKQAISFCDNFHQTPVSENVIYGSFEKKLNAIDLMEPNSRQKYLKECLQTVQEEVIPAYRRLSQYLLQLERNSLAIAGVWQLPNGDAYYRNCLLQQTTLPLDPDSLYQVGKAEMERLQSMLHNMKVFATGMELDTLENDSIGRRMTIDLFQRSCDNITPLLSSYFNSIPSLELKILELPEYRRNTGSFAFYVPPRGEPLTYGKMYVNTWKTNRFPAYLVRTFAYHEGIPGHHLQKALQAEMQQLPAFRRFLPFTAYSEGWAMYAEQLGNEMTGTLMVQDLMGQVQSELFRTTRMMTDIGIHHKKWLREQAIEFMIENANLTAAEASDEVDRYIVWPGQGCAYKVGLMKFRELRERAESEIPTFNIKEFHDVLIGHGAMPLEVLENQVEGYIERNRSNP